MSDTDDTTTRSDTGSTALMRVLPSSAAPGLLGVLALAIIATEPALAQSTGKAFCKTSIAETIRNLFRLIQFGGPLLGGVLALGATVTTPMVRRADIKKEMRDIRNQGVIWGVIVAPMGATIIQFLLNHVVAGGVSCGF